MALRVDLRTPPPPPQNLKRMFSYVGKIGIIYPLFSWALRQIVIEGTTRGVQSCVFTCHCDQKLADPSPLQRKWCYNRVQGLGYRSCLQISSAWCARSTRRQFASTPSPINKDAFPLRTLRSSSRNSSSDRERQEHRDSSNWNGNLGKQLGAKIVNSKYAKRMSSACSHVPFQSNEQIYNLLHMGCSS